jgi:hypothetical protein
MNEMIMEPIWYYTTTWDNLVKGEINVKYIIK